MSNLHRWFYLNHAPLWIWALIITGLILVAFDLGLIFGLMKALIVVG